jgi:hypothetical protein
VFVGAGDGAAVLISSKMSCRELADAQPERVGRPQICGQ